MSDADEWDYNMKLQGRLRARVDEEIYRYFLKNKHLRTWYGRPVRGGDTYYAVKRVMDHTTGKYKNLQMHRAVLEYYGYDLTGKQVDHINRDALDNRLCNLRVCTVSENLRNTGPRVTNTSGYKGVCLHKRTGKWQAKIRVHNVHTYLGQYDTPEEAAIAYNKAVDKYHGEFGYKNPIPTGGLM